MSIESRPAFRFARAGDTLAVELGERLVMENRMELKNGVLAEIAGVRVLRIHFSRAAVPTFVDSSGWGVLVGLARRAQEGGARLVLMDVDPGNLDYLWLTRLGDFFTRETSEPDRIAA